MRGPREPEGTSGKLGLQSLAMWLMEVGGGEGIWNGQGAMLLSIALKRWTSAARFGFPRVSIQCCPR